MTINESFDTEYITAEEHSDMVRALAKPGYAIKDSLTPEKCDLWHVASCVPSEAGELFDAVKKWVIYDGELDRENVIEELGDLEFYMERVRQILGITREKTLQGNLTKLAIRYGKALEYSDDAAHARADKQENDNEQA